MGWEAWLTLGVVALTLVALVREWAGPDAVLMAALLTLAVFGVLTPAETFAGFSNESMLTVGALLVLAAGMRETGALEALLSRAMGRAPSESRGLLRMIVPVTALSALLNNTTIVAMLTPTVIDWARRHGLSPSRFLLPLDYATILGGVMTLIGTTTNLTVAGLVLAAGLPPLGFFEMAPVGFPVCVAGLAYLVFVGRRLLPLRKDPVEELGERRREYTASMIVEPSSPLAGKTVEAAGLRHLPGLFLVEIDRGGRILTPVSSEEALQENDRLVFAGVVSTIVDLQKMRGLAPATDLDEPAPTDPGRRLVEAVVSHTAPMVGTSIRDVGFRSLHDAAVLAVHRGGARVPGRIGDIVLRAGDVLLLQTAQDFLRIHRNSPDFYLVSELGDATTRRRDRAPYALAILGGLLALAGFEWLPLSVAAFVAAGATVASRCISAAEARRSVEWSILIVIACSLGIGSAVQQSGLASTIAQTLMTHAGTYGPIAALTLVYISTLLLTEAVTNNAAAALMFPVALALSDQLGIDSRPFIMAICVAASCGFATPYGYQTHLIVYGAGGYRFGDFARVGIPLDLICAAVALLVIPRIWPLV